MLQILLLQGKPIYFLKAGKSKAQATYAEVYCRSES